MADTFSGYIALLLGRGDGTFRAPGYYPAGSISVGPKAADFDGDGRLDLAVARSGTIGVLPGLAAGAFGPVLTFYGSVNGSRSMAIGDFNGDGKPDLVVGDGVGQVTVFLNTTVTDRVFANGFE